MIFVLVLLLVVVIIPIATEMRRQMMDRKARKRAEGNFAELSQGITYYQWLGPVRGPVVVCIHGLSTPSFVWNGLARGLAQMGFRVLVYDLYGRGYSDRPKGAQDSAFFLQQLDDLLEDQDIHDDITLMGYSMGGGIAAGFAAAHPGKVRQLVLLAPIGMGVSADKSRMFQFIKNTPFVGDWLMLATYPRELAKNVRAEQDAPSSVEGISKLCLNELTYRGYIPAILASMRGILSQPLEAEHHAIHQAGIPVLAIWAQNDKIIPLSAMGQLTSWSRNTRQEVIEGAGHGLPYTHTDQILETMRETLRDGIN